VKERKKPAQQRSFHMLPIVKRVRMVFYMLATVELVLASIIWGLLPLH
jgi:hypothetical protein